ncbi:hypothetical protein [Trichlorobacter sp.]|uniref:hypothetical protein n=1 Tax=Trichlorobacter sp. TaxID=2911007 RepID=UPI002A3716F6|nr:hypothetical protein [Trichlorobacter sp.]MDY0383815.1 hypothetical protein [Trichlorobacter sp.]
MTLCTAWVRQENDKQELIVATDSCLSGGERWHTGVKLFELPRKDCLICFAGDTERTYPLILNLISSIKFDAHLSSASTDIKEVLEYITNLFTELCNSISNYGTREFKDVLGSFNFLFGGWSWKDSKFYIWRLDYLHDAKGFVPTQDHDNLIFSFIGDNLYEAQELLQKELVDNRKVLAGRLDMEPLNVLIRMIREKEYDSIDGAIQLAKIYPPGSVEFFGVMWPSISGKKTFLGKDVTFDNNPDVKFIDPDTGSILGHGLPETLDAIDENIFGTNAQIVKELYPDGHLKPNATARQKMVLKQILAEVAYSNFVNGLVRPDEEEDV